MIYERSPKLSAALQTKYLLTYVYLILQDFLRSLLKFESSKATEIRTKIKQKCIHIYNLDRPEDAWISVLSLLSTDWLVLKHG
jgi:hypothetical protein